MVFKILDKKSAVSATHTHTGTETIFKNHQLAEQLYKPLTSKFWKRRVLSSFMDIIYGTDLADMRLISKYFIMCFWYF